MKNINIYKQTSTTQKPSKNTTTPARKAEQQRCRKLHRWHRKQHPHNRFLAPYVTNQAKVHHTVSQAHNASNCGSFVAKELQNDLTISFKRLVNPRQGLFLFFLSSFLRSPGRTSCPDCPGRSPIAPASIRVRENSKVTIDANRKRGGERERYVRHKQRAGRCEQRTSSPTSGPLRQLPFKNFLHPERILRGADMDVNENNGQRTTVRKGRPVVQPLSEERPPLLQNPTQTTYKGI